jgi:hypothetical protein
MKTATLETSDANFARIVAALRAKLDSDAIEGMSDGQVWRYDLKEYYKGMVVKNERHAAQSGVSPDDGIVEVA